MDTVRRSKKREAILEALRQTKEHPSAEMLYMDLKQQYKDLSLATVYRNLAMFVRTGEAVCVGTVDGVDRFDADMSEHHHFICDECGGVSDLMLSIDMESLYSKVIDETGAELSRHSLSFGGLCSGCKAT